MTRTHLRWTLALAGLCAAPVLTGCGESGPTGPVELTATETFAALDFRAELPSLAAHLDRLDHETARAAAARWNGSWDLPPDEGHVLRRELLGEYAPELAAGMAPEEIADGIEALDEALREVDRVLDSEDAAHLLPALSEARAAREAAGRELQAGDHDEALLYQLEGFDRLRTATAGALARELLRLGEGRFREVSEGSVDVDGTSARRAERMLVGARAALESGAPVVALRRAWYAVRLLEEEGPR